jgi:hypothetical protein
MRVRAAAANCPVERLPNSSPANVSVHGDAGFFSELIVVNEDRRRSQ